MSKSKYQTEWSKEFIKDCWNKFEAENINDSIYYTTDENSERVVVVYKKKYKKDFFKFIRLLIQSVIRNGEVVGDVVNIFNPDTFEEFLKRKLSQLPINAKLEDGEKYIIDYNIKKTDGGIYHCFNAIVPVKNVVICSKEEYDEYKKRVNICHTV